ncbi:MAG: glycosyl hydrolase family 18 [Lachnospiraceae bacterium]|nr:glycosyl hydrolase family 18 [Lachnospiraceae bacterium]
MDRRGMHDGYRDFDGDRRVVRRRKKRKNRNRRLLRTLLPPFLAILVIIIIIIVAIKTGLFEGSAGSDTKADLYEYYGVKDDSSAILIKDNELTEERIVVKEDSLYMPLSQIKELYTDRFYYEKAEDSVIYTREDDSFKTVIGESSYSNSQGSVDLGHTICYKDNSAELETIYMSLDYVKLFCNLELNLFGGKGEPYRALIRNEWGKEDRVTVTKETALRVDDDKKSPYVTKLLEGQSLVCIVQEGEWTKALTDELHIGYVKTEYLGPVTNVAQTPVTDVPEEKFTSMTSPEPVVLMWHSIAGTAGNESLNSAIEGTKGITVLAPTWYSLEGSDGKIRSFSSKTYVDTVHSKGMKVWAVVDDFNADGDASELLPYPDKRALLISQLISDAKSVGVDGLNVDFETIKDSFGEAFIQFIRELSIECHKNGLVVSVDNYVPKAYNRHYHRKEQGIFTDYVIIMGYDETYAGSAKAGSVASINYVKEGIEETLKEVPANKVINALPFYTRVWEETPKTEAEMAETPPGEEVISYKLSVLATPSLKQEDELLSNYNATKTWDESTMQNYATWKVGEKTYEVWLEDEVSLSAKLGLMQGYGIGGVAGWELSLAAPYVWDLIEQWF